MMSVAKLSLALSPLMLLHACDREPRDPRGVGHDETLLSVSATGQGDTRPDQAQFQAGINSWAKSAAEATAANQQLIGKIVDALSGAGIAEKDIQTRSLSVQRLDWGDRKGQYQASNIINVTVRDVDRASAAVTAATTAGANVLSGPDLRMADPEKAANSAYTAAYKAAHARAEAYADAAGMTIARVLSIRDAGGTQGNRYLPGAVPVAPPPIAVEQSAANASNVPLMPGQTTSTVAVQVDFALKPK
jgi:uncharacterized protein